MNALRKEGLAENTLVFFSSDNGPWVIMGNQGGSAGPLRDGKGSTYEGGMRVPGIAWMPGKIKPGVVHEQASTLDLLPTALAMAGVKTPEGVILDGLDLSGTLFEGKVLPERPFFYYRGAELFACRLGEWKAHFITQPAYGPGSKEVHNPPVLYRLGRDVGEKRDVAKDFPEVVARIEEAVRIHQAGMKPGEPQLK
jgi:arylsulfatase A-like enzyme